MTLRNFQESTPQYEFYHEQHMKQTYDFAKSQLAKYRDSE